MKLIVITRPDFFAGEAGLLNMLFEAGLPTLHLRKPNATVEQTERLLRQLPPACLPRIVVHDNHSLALRYPLAGIHLNGRNPLPPIGYAGSISRSCHSLSEVRQHKDACRYVFLSPIFNSISKAGYNGAFSPDTLREAANEGTIDAKVIALGGLCAANIPTARRFGFGGVALIGDVWETPASRFLAHFQEILSLTADHE